MEDRAKLKDAKKIIVKLGTSSLTHPSGKLNFERIERLARVIADIKNAGKQIALVSSGAIAVGSSKVYRKDSPQDITEKQALAAIGQAELMKIYQKFFAEYNQIVAQVLITRDIVNSEIRGNNAKNTINTLLEMDIIPIINENDTVATDEIEHLGYGDNDRLSADVAALVEADLLIILSDIDGLFSDDPNKNKNAEKIHKVIEITPEIEQIALGPNSSFAKGGMSTKIAAAKICAGAGIHMVITNGKEPSAIYDILKGKNIGTHFVAST